MTDAEILAALTEIPPEAYDLTLRAMADGAAREGKRISVYEAPTLAIPPDLAPCVIVVHVAERPSMASIRAEYLNMRARCERERS